MHVLLRRVRLRGPYPSAGLGSRVAHGEGLSEAESALVEGPADDDAGQVPGGGGEVGEGCEVLESSDAAAGDHRDRGRREDRVALVEVGSVHGAVPADLGDDERRDPGVLEPGGEVEEVVSRRGGPGPGGDGAAAGGEAHRDTAGRGGAQLVD